MPASTSEVSSVPGKPGSLLICSIGKSSAMARISGLPILAKMNAVKSPPVAAVW